MERRVEIETPYAADHRAQAIAATGPHSTEDLADWCGYSRRYIARILSDAAQHLWDSDPELCEELIASTGADESEPYDALAVFLRRVQVCRDVRAA